MYLQLRHGCALRSMPYLGVRAKSDVMIEHRFENRTGIVERKTDAEREQAGKQQNFLHPRARIQFALRADVKDGDGNVMRSGKSGHR